MSGEFILPGVQRVGWGQEAGPREEAKRTRGPRIPALGGSWERSTMSLTWVLGRIIPKLVSYRLCLLHAIHMHTQCMCLTSAPPCKAHAATPPASPVGLWEQPPPGPSVAAPCPEAIAGAGIPLGLGKGVVQ